MGQNFVAIEGGTPEAPKLLAGGTLETTEQPDLSAIMVKLENVASGVEGLTKSFSSENMSTLLGPAHRFHEAEQHQHQPHHGQHRATSPGRLLRAKDRLAE